MITRYRQHRHRLRHTVDVAEALIPPTVHRTVHEVTATDEELTLGMTLQRRTQDAVRLATDGVLHITHIEERYLIRPALLRLKLIPRRGLPVGDSTIGIGCSRLEIP